MLKRRPLGLCLLFLAVVVALYGGIHHWSAASRIIASAILGLFGAALVSSPDGSSVANARRSRKSARRPRIPPLKPGEAYDTTVKLTTLPNVPIAELWCQRLREHGIEAFYKGGSPLAGVYGTQLDAALPAELWVGEHDAKRAAQLMRELR
jgi:hypothetical protein